MKINYMGYDVECTPKEKMVELMDLLGSINKQSHYSPPSTSPNWQIQ